MQSELEGIKSALLSNTGRKALGQEALPQAAVAMIIRPNTRLSQLETLLLKRMTRESDPWSGHMAFPGGRYEDKDGLILSTAIREVLEETGIDLRNCSMLGTLDEVIPITRAIRVTPYVALAPEGTEVNLNASEIAEHVWVPLTFFKNRSNLRPYLICRNGIEIVVPSFLYREKYVIWGMTLRMIEDFVEKVY